jgi:predicted metal-dependent TIM-barrel fold hydrolase
MEHCANRCTTGKVPWDVCLAQIKAIGCDHLIISSDLGQLKHEYPDDGLLHFAQWMLDNGISENDVRKTIRDNPRQLLLG